MTKNHGRIAFFFISVSMANIRVKICGLTSVDDAVMACHAGADAIGLVFYPPSTRHVDIATAKAIVTMLPPFVQSVALFVNPQRQFVEQVLQQVAIDLLQFHGDESEQFCASFSRPYIKAFAMRDDIQLEQNMKLYASAKGFLLDAWHPRKPGGTGERFDWQRFPQHADKPLILAGGLTVDNVQQGITQCQPYAVDVSGGVEQSPGKKSAEKVQLFIQQAKSLL